MSWPLLRMISGATYSGVPQNVHVLRPWPTFFANPKSTYTEQTKRGVRLINTDLTLPVLGPPCIVCNVIRPSIIQTQAQRHW